VRKLLSSFSYCWKPDTIRFIQGKRRLLGDLIATSQCLKGAYKKVGEGLFTMVCSDRTRDNGFKLKKGSFRLDIRKKFFTMRVVRHWNRFVDAPSLEMFKVGLDEALSNLVQWKMTLPMAVGLELDDLEDSFQPKSFYNSVILKQSGYFLRNSA